VVRCDNPKAAVECAGPDKPGASSRRGYTPQQGRAQTAARSAARASRRRLEPCGSPDLVGARRAEQNLVRVGRVGPLRVDGIGQVPHTKSDAQVLDLGPPQIPAAPAVPNSGATVVSSIGSGNANATWLDTSGATPVVRTGGVNCWKSLSVGSNRSLTVPANFGPLYVNGGNVNLQGAFTCNGCAIVLTNKDTSSTATIGTWSSNAQATNNITAPTSGTYKGIAIYQDRRATGNIDQINGGSGNVINGVVYFPSDTLWLNGTGDATSLCSMFVAKNLKFNGTGRIAISSAADAACFGVGLPNTQSVTIVRLIA